MRYGTFASLALAAVAWLHGSSADALLSTPRSTDRAGDRATEISAFAARIKNEPRTFMVGNQSLPYYTGPNPTRGSLAEQLRLSEVVRVDSFYTNLPPYVATIAVFRASTLKTPADVVALYDYMTERAERPMATDISDEGFGAQRLSIRAMRLRLVGPKEATSCRFQLSDAQLAKICGRGGSWQSLRATKRLFVEDYSDIAQWNDPATVDTKYVPNVVGYFCYNRESQKLLPVEIRFLETGVNYSPLDSDEEWTLAKMGLNAASVSFHQMFHMADTHAMHIPMRVELYRTMAGAHPVRALLSHHMAVDLGLEMLLATVLLSPNTPLDQTFGLGATGGTRYLDYLLRTSVSVANDLPTDLEKRGLTGIPNHKYALYGGKLFTAISEFVASYVGAYYASDKAVAADFELQNWAAACVKVPHLKDFPAKIQTKTCLSKLLTHLVFQSAVKHHAMNAAATWHMMAVPYSPAALWKKLPTTKVSVGEKLDLMAYMVPVAKMHVAIGLAAMFYFPPPPSETLAQAYRKAPFVNETCIQPAISRFEKALAAIDDFIVKKESGEAVQYKILRPSALPFDSWA